MQLIETMSLSDAITSITSNPPAASAGGKLFSAIIGQCDKLNLNGRIYPAAEWRRNVRVCNLERCAAGTLCGGIDHAESGDYPIIWRRLSIDDDGRVRGEFELAEGGEDLRKMINAGAAIAFSTVGAGDTRAPTKAERLQYGISDDGSAVIVENWQLSRIDAVRFPSCESARLQKRLSAAEVFESFCFPRDDEGMRKAREFADRWK